MEQSIKQMEQMVNEQRKKLFAIARRLVPKITPEDLLQPQDYPELELHPEFRYEEGILAGLETVLSALYALKKEHL